MRLVPLVLLVASLLPAAEPPFPDALAAAAVNPEAINAPTDALVLGNGEVNALVYRQGRDVRVRLAKNDVWDLRVDTAADPPIPVVDVAAGTARVDGKCQSWNRPFPTALPCGEVVLSSRRLPTGGEADRPSGSGAQPLKQHDSRANGPVPATPEVPPVAGRVVESVSGAGEPGPARLDLATATATVNDRASETLTLRVLAGSNVLLVDTTRTADLRGALDFLPGKNLTEWILPAERGRDDTHTWLHQPIPGDADVKPMSVWLVTAARNGRLAVAVATSRESADPRAMATRLADEAVADPDRAVAAHASAWADFWAASGVALGDAELQRWWYRTLYFFRTFACGGGNAIGLAANFPGLAGWHNSLKLNYNIQQTYLAAVPANHPELCEPFIDVLTASLPRGRWFAANGFPGAEGAFLHSDLWPFEPDPKDCTTPNKHQLAYMPWGYSWGMAGHSMAVLWEYYRYDPTPQRLERIWPVIRDFGTFYCSLLERCRLVDGHRRMGPSYFPELGGFDEFNTAYDIAFVTAGLRITRDAAVAHGDAALQARVEALLPQVPAFDRIADPKQDGQTIIRHWSGSSLEIGSDRHGTLIQGIFPAGLITWWSPPEERALGIRTIAYVERSTTHANSNVMINIARARLGLGDEAISNAKLCFSGTEGRYSKEKPNGTFYWNAHGCFMTEQVAINRLVTELLVQSVGGIIRVFPAWPAGQPARFANLLAEGGIEVSAERTPAGITALSLRSRRGGTIRLADPWPQGFAVQVGDRPTISVDRSDGVGSFPSQAGTTYRIIPVTSTP